MARILNFGSLNVDHVYRVDSFLRPGETKPSRSYETHCGGKGLNQSVAAARAGAEVWHAALLGAGGDMLADMLKKSGVRLDLLERTNDPCGHAIIQVDDAGQNCILLYGGTNRMLSETLIGRAVEAFGRDGLVLLQNETNLTGEILRAAKTAGLTTAFNAAPMDGAVREYPLHLVDWLIVNELEGAALADCGSEAEILPALRRRWPSMNILLTLGARGAVCLRGGETETCGVYDVPVSDSTGAGDTFLGYFLTDVLGGASTREALRAASAAASLCVQRAGAADSVPLRLEVRRAMERGELGAMGAFGGYV